MAAVPEVATGIWPAVGTPVTVTPLIVVTFMLEAVVDAATNGAVPVASVEVI